MQSHKFTLPVNSICPCSSLSPCTSSSVQLASYLNSSLLVRSCFTFLKCSYKLSLITLFPGKALQSIALTSPFYVWYHESLIYFEIKWPAQYYKRKQYQSIKLKFRSASHSPPKDESQTSSFSCLKIKPYEKKLKPQSALTNKFTNNMRTGKVWKAKNGVIHWKWKSCHMAFGMGKVYLL